MNRVFMFPGQSSRYPEMIRRIVEAYAPARSIVQNASDILARDLFSVYQTESEAFELNRDVQVGVFLTSHLYMLALQANGVDADSSLGLSLGEYNHLVHIGAIDFEAALRLVDARGRVYDEGPEGMMVALFPIDREEVEDVLKRVQDVGCVQIANFNTPSQFVIAGQTAAVLAAMEIAQEEFSIDPVIIEKKIPMHTPVFRCVADALLPHLERAPFRTPSRPYISNVLGTVVENPTPARIVELLAQHVYSPVLWRQAIDDMAGRVPEAVFVEVGPRGVLYNMLQKRWHANLKFKTDVREDIAANIHHIKGTRNHVQEVRA